MLKKTLDIKRKIIFLGRYPESGIIGGPEKYSVGLFNEILKIADANFVEYYFKSYKRSNVISRMLGKEIISLNPPVLRFGSLRLFLYLLKNRCAIIHILSAERFTIPVYIYGVLFKLKIITTFHSVLKYEIPMDRNRKKIFSRYRDYIWEILAIKLSSRLIYLSQVHLNLAKKYYTIDCSKTKIIPIGIYNSFYRKEEKNFSAELLKFVFYNGINDSIERGFEFILNAFKHLHHDNYKLYIIGNDNNIIHSNINMKFIPLMKAADLIGFLEDKHILIKSNSFDSFPIFMLEAMAAGLVPVISSNVGVSSFIRHGKNGFIYPSSDILEFINLLDNILTKKYDLNIISNEAKLIHQELSWENVTDLYKQVYNSL